MVQPELRLLLIGDKDQSVAGVLSRALPDVAIIHAASVFDGIHQLHASRFANVVLATEPIERRPEAAIRVLRQLVGPGKLIAFGQPTLEPLNRKLVEMGVDDYFVTPADETELRQVFASVSAPSSMASQSVALTDIGLDSGYVTGAASRIAATSATGAMSGFIGLAHAPLAELLADVLVQHPSGAIEAMTRRMNARLPAGQVLVWLPVGGPVQAVVGKSVQLPVKTADRVYGQLRLEIPDQADEGIARHMIAQLAGIFAKISLVEERNVHLQRLATTDELTGLNNGRFFRHKLRRIIEVAKERRSPVTLLLFDIDNFKRYNDTYGHGVGDEILKQTATLMRRACRKHDVVARISGDEFAVVFWEKENRQLKDPQSAGRNRVPQTPLIIAQRFRQLLASSEFSVLGPQGRGALSISGGMAVYPFDGDTPDKLYDAADRALMFGAKRSGKNQIVLIGEDQSISDLDTLTAEAKNEPLDPDLPPWEEV